MNHSEARAKAKGVHCPFCSGSRFRTVSRYRPLVNVKILYCRCSGCKARIKLRVTLVHSSRADSSPTIG